MPYSDVQICNLALSRCGVNVQIESLTEGSAEADACLTNYAPCRDYVLSRSKWPFTTRWVDLGLVATDPNSDWSYSYRYPSDCVIAMRLVLGYSRSPVVNPSYEISSDASGFLILCDVENATLEYSASATNAGFYSDALASAIAWRLASETAIPLGRAISLADRANSMFDRELSVAKAFAKNQPQPDPIPTSCFERARYGSGGVYDAAQWPNRNA